MNPFERIVGLVIAVALTLFISAAILLSMYNFAFRDGRGSSLYGGRGDTYMYDNY